MPITSHATTPVILYGRAGLQQHCISSLPAEQDGGGHVGKTSRHRLSEWSPPPPTQPPIRMQHASLPIGSFFFFLLRAWASPSLEKLKPTCQPLVFLLSPSAPGDKEIEARNDPCTQDKRCLPGKLKAKRLEKQQARRNRENREAAAREDA